LTNKNIYKPETSAVTTQTQYTATSANPSIRGNVSFYTKTYGWYILQWAAILLLAFISFIIIKRILIIFYDLFHVSRMIYFKVILPRGEGKIDREQEKELAKDMKEKIW